MRLPPPLGRQNDKMNRTRKYSWAWTALVGMSAGFAPTPLSPQYVGDRVRVTTVNDRVVVGTLAARSQQGFNLMTENGFRSVPFQEVSRFELGLGTQSQWKEGLRSGGKLGAYIGAGAGAAYWAVCFTVSLGQGDFCAEALWRPALAMTGLGVGLGAGLGAALGAGFVEDEWEVIPLQELGDEVPGAAVNDGIRVRVSVDGNRLIGHVTTIDDEGFEFVQGAMHRSFAFRDVDGLEQSFGMRSLWKWGLGIGFVGGGVAKAATGGEFRCIVSCDDTELEQQIFIWSLAGGALGTALGFSIKREAWEPVPLRTQGVGLSTVVAPRRGPAGRYGLLLGARIKF